MTASTARDMKASTMRDLKMAEISLAKVRDVGKMQKDAVAMLNDFRVSIQVKDEVVDALNTIESLSDYQITPKMAEDVDNVINSNGVLVVKNGFVSITGTESFGLNMLPAEWRITRVAALKELLSESYKNIKRWANQLSDNFQRRWVELTTSTEVLESRLESVIATMDVVSGIHEGATTVELNELLARSISKNGKVLSGDQAKALQGEITYITSCLRMWEMEQIRFKNTVIRYFGNDRNQDLTMVERTIPKLFDQRGKIDDRAQESVIFARDTRPMLDGYYIQGIGLQPKWVKDNIKGPQDNTLYADSLSLTGYELLRDESTKASKAQVSVMTLTQLFIVRDVVQSIIDKLKAMNREEDPVNFNPDDVKDVLNTLRAGDTDQARAYQYGLITADYQFNVNNFKTQVSSMLIVLANHYITMMNQHLECYDVE